MYKSIIFAVGIAATNPAFGQTLNNTDTWYKICSQPEGHPGRHLCTGYIGGVFGGLKVYRVSNHLTVAAFSGFSGGLFFRR
jgi:hypothetical protein